MLCRIVTLKFDIFFFFLKFHNKNVAMTFFLLIHSIFVFLLLLFFLLMLAVYVRDQFPNCGPLGYRPRPPFLLFAN